MMATSSQSGGLPRSGSGSRLPALGRELLVVDCDDVVARWRVVAQSAV